MGTVEPRRVEHSGAGGAVWSVERPDDRGEGKLIEAEPGRCGVELTGIDAAEVEQAPPAAVRTDEDRLDGRIADVTLEHDSAAVRRDLRVDVVGLRPRMGQLAKAGAVGPRGDDLRAPVVLRVACPDDPPAAIAACRREDRRCGSDRQEADGRKDSPGNAKGAIAGPAVSLAVSLHPESPQRVTG